MIDFPISYRCIGKGHDCALSRVHHGRCKTEHELRVEALREASPTLSDIRRVVREEIRLALKDLLG
jgi:hypothetical protein